MINFIFELLLSPFSLFGNKISSNTDIVNNINTSDLVSSNSTNETQITNRVSENKSIYENKYIITVLLLSCILLTSFSISVYLNWDNITDFISFNFINKSGALSYHLFNNSDITHINLGHYKQLIDLNPKNMYDAISWKEVNQTFSYMFSNYIDNLKGYSTNYRLYIQTNNYLLGDVDQTSARIVAWEFLNDKDLTWTSVCFSLTVIASLALVSAYFYLNLSYLLNLF